MRFSRIHPRLVESDDLPLSGVRVWTAQLGALSRSERDELSASLDSAEQARAARFHFERDRENFVAARGLLRSLLGAIFQEAPAGLVFEYGEHGKPALAPVGQGLTARFNLSHSAGWAMFAVGCDREVGIDLEAADRLQPNDDDLLPLATRILSARELAVWRELPNANARHAAFLRAWTRKEAYTKATGRGFSEGLHGIELALDARNPARSSTFFRANAADGPRTPWFVHDLNAPAGFAAALALEQPFEDKMTCSELTASASLRDAQGSRAGHF